jgi:hypothetical protein
VSHPNIARLALAFIAAAVITACDRAVTDPSPPMRPAGRIAHEGDDTLTCRAGWQIVGGRYVCNPE